MRVLAAMSGGVDSSVAAYLMKERGYEVIGVMMKLWCPEKSAAEKDISDAAAVCERLGIPFSVYDLCEDFKSRIIDGFVSEYENGNTPNPCIECNKYIKFGKLFEIADRLSCDRIVTGHYARIGQDEKSGGYLIRKGEDPLKDQSYVLYNLDQKKLSRIGFPIGEMSKAGTRAIAERLGLPVSEKKESQDICFVPDGDYAAFIERHTGRIGRSGNFVLENGEIIGTHKGMIRYTVGQRRGLGLSLLSPLYVLSKDPVKNTVTLCPEERLYAKEIEVRNVNYISDKKPGSPFECRVRTRYRQKEVKATVFPNGNGARIEFAEAVRAPAPGQSAVFYDNDILIGGGTIVKNA